MPQKLLSAAAFAVVTSVLLAPSAAAAPRAVADNFKRLFPQASVTSVKATPLPGIYEVVSDGQVMYMTEDGNFMLDGSIWDTANRRDLTENTNKRLRRVALKRIGKDQMISYVPDHTKYTVSVFTDVECGYCRKFHAHMPELQKLGIRVNYLMTPFRGEQARAKAIGVWCADDRNAAMDLAKSGAAIPPKQCDNPIESHLRAAREVGVRGTPAIVLESGAFIGGYVPPKKLLEALVADADQSL